MFSKKNKSYKNRPSNKPSNRVKQYQNNKQVEHCNFKSRTKANKLTLEEIVYLIHQMSDAEVETITSKLLSANRDTVALTISAPSVYTSKNLFFIYFILFINTILGYVNHADAATLSSDRVDLESSGADMDAAYGISKPAAEVGPFFQSIAAKTVKKEEMNCKAKTVGIVKGKICTIESNKHIMKEIAQKEEEELIMINDKENTAVKSNIHRINYMSKIVNMISNTVVQPEITVFHEVSNNGPGIFYSGSKVIPDFVPAREMYKRFNSLNIKEIRYVLDKMIGKENFHNLMVITSFIPDLIAGGMNWGYDSKNQLVLVDIDYPTYFLKDMIGGLMLALEDMNTMKIALSRNDLIKIKEIYVEMLKKPQPQGHNSIQMSSDAFNYLVNSYIKIYDQLIKSIDPKRNEVLDNNLSLQLYNLIGKTFENSDAIYERLNTYRKHR